MDSRDDVQAALGRLADAGDYVSARGTIDPETLWHQVKFHLAPVCDQLANDLRRFSSGAWTLDIYILKRPGPWSTWHDASAKWHAQWTQYGKSRIGQFYAPGDGKLLLAIPSKPPRQYLPEEPDPGILRELIERATTILENGLAGAPLL